MHSTFNEIENSNAPKLNNPHFIVDYESKHGENPFPSVAFYIIFVGKSNELFFYEKRDNE